MIISRNVCGPAKSIAAARLHVYNKTVYKATMHWADSPTRLVTKCAKIRSGRKANTATAIVLLHCHMHMHKLTQTKAAKVNEPTTCS